MGEEIRSAGIFRLHSPRAVLKERRGKKDERFREEMEELSGQEQGGSGREDGRSPSSDTDEDKAGVATQDEQPPAGLGERLDVST